MTREEFGFWLETNQEDALNRAKQSSVSLDSWIDRLAIELKALAKKSQKKKREEEEALFDDPDGEDDDFDDGEEDGDE